jgi:hypothetical protein
MTAIQIELPDATAQAAREAGFLALMPSPIQIDSDVLV